MAEDLKITESERHSVAARDAEKTFYEVDNVTINIGTSEDGAFAYDAKLRRGLQQRHIQMIALAGAIGTGLFLSSGGSLAKSGPVGVLLAYIVVGFAVCCVQLATAEVSTFMPVTGSYIRHAEYFVDPAFGFAIGWNRVYSTLVSGPGEITAAALCFEYWTDISPAVWITILILLIIISNLGPVRYYGEIEYFFSILKILLIVGCIILGLVIDLGGTGVPRLGFHYWKDPGPFATYLVEGSVGKFVGFWSVLSSAVYAYGGVNDIAVAAAEVQNPRTNIPKACKRIFFRVFVFYIVFLFVVTLIVPYNNKKLATSTGNAESSPIVIAIELAGIKALPSIVNAIVITSAWSAGNAGMLFGSRSLYALAAKGQAPKVFLRTNRWDVPYMAVGIKTLFFLLSYMSVQNTAATVFSWFQNLTSASLLATWIVICVNHIFMMRALKAQGYTRKDLPWSTPVTAVAAWAGLILSGLFLLTGGFTVFIHGHWDTSKFFSSYFNIPFFAVLYVIGRLLLKSKLVDPREVDLQSIFTDIQNNPETPVPPRKWYYFSTLWE